MILLLIFFSAASIAVDQQLAGLYYEKALQKVQQGRTREAVIELKNAIQQNPNYLAAYALMAEVQLQDKNLIATEVALSQADQHGVDPALLVLTRAQLYLYQLKFDQMVKEILPERYNEQLRGELHILRGHAYLEVRRLSHALNEYDAALPLTQNRVEPIVGRANVLLNLGNFEAAMVEADKAIRKFPESAGGWYVKAAINHRQGLLNDALTGYEKALIYEPAHYDARIARAGVLMDLKRDDPVEKDLQHLRENYPFDAKAAYLQAVFYARQKREKEAKAALVAAAGILDGIEPEFLGKHSSSLMLAGLVNYSLERFELSKHYLKLYIGNFPEQPGAYKLLASILLAEGHNEQAIKLLSPVISFSPDDYRLSYLLGKAYMQDGQHDRANQYFEQAARYQKGQQELGTELSLSHWAMGQENLAVSQLEEVLAGHPDNSKAGISLIILYLQRHEPDKAVTIAKKMVSELPEHLTLLNLLASSQVSAGQRDEARQTLQRIISKDADFITAHINLAKLDLLEGNSAAARERMQKLLLHTPDNIALLLELASVYGAEKNADKEGETIQRALQADPSSVQAVLALIELKLNQGRYAEALAVAQKADTNHRNHDRIQDALVRAFIAVGNKGKAAGVLNRMAKNAGFDARRLYKVAMKQFSVEDTDNGIKSLKNAVLGSAHYLPARIALAEAEIQFGKTLFATNHADFIIQHYPESPHGYRLLGDIEMKNGDTQKGLVNYQQAFEKSADAFILMKIYSALKEIGKQDQAFTLLQEWMNNNPQDGAPAQALAEEYLIRHDYDKARKYYERLLFSAPQRADLLNNLAYIYFEQGNEKALDFAIRAQQLAPDAPSSNDTLGWILVNKGQLERGLSYLRNAFARSSQDPEIRYHIAVALAGLNRTDEAVEELQQAIKMSPVFNGSEDAKKMLEQLIKR